MPISARRAVQVLEPEKGEQVFPRNKPHHRWGAWDKVFGMNPAHPPGEQDLRAAERTYNCRRLLGSKNEKTHPPWGAHQHQHAAERRGMIPSRARFQSPADRSGCGRTPQRVRSTHPRYRSRYPGSAVHTAIPARHEASNARREALEQAGGVGSCKCQCYSKHWCAAEHTPHQPSIPPVGVAGPRPSQTHQPAAAGV